ncbi:hypothetical protein ACIQGZ_16855 [Streptomyces sp. NPDC092296]|uniref:hypothetical protein n=1 Tax=Streptomyces sp. NPDC092296 TaxID=3366012 RepID=UPI00381549F6
MTAEGPVIMTVRAYRRTPDGGQEELKAAEVRQGEPASADRYDIAARYPPCQCPRHRAPERPRT